MLGLLARGHSNGEIARRLVITPKTAMNHVEHIYGKLGVVKPRRGDASTRPSTG